MSPTRHVSSKKSCGLGELAQPFRAISRAARPIRPVQEDLMTDLSNAGPRLAARPRDIADIGDILFTQGELDRAYLRSWAERLGVLENLERVLEDPPRI
jgi:hypothetical protein